MLTCGLKTCSPCSDGQRNSCPVGTFIVSLCEDAITFHLICVSVKGIGGGGGGLAEYISVHQDRVHVLPQNIPCKFACSGLFKIGRTSNDCFIVAIGALLEPLAVSWHAVKKSGLKPGGKALVLGGGPVSTAAYFKVHYRV